LRDEAKPSEENDEDNGMKINNNETKLKDTFFY
jgi:hypothetical protein